MGWGMKWGGAQRTPKAEERTEPTLGRPVPTASAAAAARRATPTAPALQPPVPETSWNARVFEHIEWRRFEAVCEGLFAQSGMRAETQSHGADGGVDIWLWSQFSDKPVIVQCKHWKKRPVGVKEMREFYGVLKSHDLTYGTFATSSTFSQDALAFAKGNRINAQDRDGLLKLIASRTAQQQQSLLNMAYDGDYWKPTCVKCGAKMVLRDKQESGHFWGCSNFSTKRCRNTMRFS